jgi:hypothetical protein
MNGPRIQDVTLACIAKWDGRLSRQKSDGRDAHPTQGPPRKPLDKIANLPKLPPPYATGLLWAKET